MESPRVEAARGCQRQRFRGTNLLSNADMGPADVRELAAWTKLAVACSKRPCSAEIQ
jgi:hypothetical protein